MDVSTPMVTLGLRQYVNICIVHVPEIARTPEMTHLPFGLAFLGKLTKLRCITGCINLYKSYLLQKYKS